MTDVIDLGKTRQIDKEIEKSKELAAYFEDNSVEGQMSRFADALDDIFLQLDSLQIHYRLLSARIKMLESEMMDSGSGQFEPGNC